ncbi:MAG TPA: sensor histidine kinase [Mucilaginibacter sp.]|nr:sensor histidine kinase [Mucilaginibacter sp.]
MILPVVALSQDSPDKQIDELNDIAKRNMRKPDSMIVYAEKAYALAKQHNYKAGEATALKFKGVYEYGKSNFDTAISYYLQELGIFTDLNNTLEIGKANLNIAIAYESKRDYVNTMKYALGALPVFEKLGDNNGKGRVLNILGITSNIQGEFNKAKEYFFEYNALVKSVKDSSEIATSYNNIGSTYSSMHRDDSALYFLKKSLQMNLAISDNDGAGKNYENIASIYEDKKDYANALTYHLKSMNIYKTAGNRRFLCHSYFNVGHIYKKMKDTANALKWFDKALKLGKSINENETVADSYKELAGIQANDNQFKVAYESLRASASARDSILNEATTKAVEEYKIKYETEKKEHQVIELRQQTALQQLQLEQKNIYLGVAALIILVVAAVGYLVYSRRKANERVAIQKEINRQQEITANEILNAEERERRRMGSDLHDGVGQLLSTALLNLNRLVKLDGFNTEQQKLADLSLSLVSDGYDEVRSISHQIIPNALLKYGLSAAVRDFLSKIDEHVMKVSLETVGITERLNEQLETILYRVIQETVNNVIKHAKANRLSIQLVKDEDGISLSVEDNGKGFDVNKLDKSAGIGMKNIYSRIAFLKGIIDIQSGEGKGTLISIYIPA